MACGEGIQLNLEVVAAAGQGGVLQRAGGQQLIQRASPGLPGKALAELAELYENYAALVVASAQEQVSGRAFDLAGGSASTAAAGVSADQAQQSSPKLSVPRASP